MKFFNFGTSVRTPVEMATDISSSEEPITSIQFQESNPKENELKEENARLKGENSLIKDENAFLKDENTLLKSQMADLQAKYASEAKQQKNHIDQSEKNEAPKVSDSFTQTEASSEDGQENSQTVSVAVSSAPVPSKASGAIPKAKTLKKTRSSQKSTFFQMDFSSSQYRHLKAPDKPNSKPTQPQPPPILNKNNFPTLPNPKPSYAGALGPKPLASPPTPLAYPPSVPLHPTKSPPFLMPPPSLPPLRPMASPSPQMAQNHLSVPLPHPPPPKRVIIYGTSNYQTRHHQLKSSLRSLRQDSKEKYDIQFIRSYTLEKTFEMVKTRDHTDAIVVVSVLTNNARKGQSLSHIRGYQEAIIWMLKQETDAKNIVFLACPPATAFQTSIYNCYTQDLCDKEGIRFSNTLIKQDHLGSDGYHLQFKHQHLMSKSVAAAILDMEI